MKYPNPRLSRHHRKPRSLGGGNGTSNISMVDPKRHAAWHMIAGNKTPQQIADHINRVWLDPSVKFIVVKADE